MLEHGGRLRQAAQQYEIPLAQWLDLSTGLNPNGWPVPPVPDTAWARLPEEEDGLMRAAKDYYGVAKLLPVAGSQAAIQALPQLWCKQQSRAARIGMLAVSYAEHAHCWHQQGHQVVVLDGENMEQDLPELDCLLLVNPNNPDGRVFGVQQLLAWRKALPAHAWLIVDEAFMDAGVFAQSRQQVSSMAEYCELEGVIVLRSLGKFFGLAGARVGFVLSNEPILQALREMLGPWSLSGPSRYIATRALSDRGWQQQARVLLLEQGRKLKSLLHELGFETDGASPLFQYLQLDDAHKLHQFLATRGIWTRHFPQWQGMRFGLPATEKQWLRLHHALLEYVVTHRAHKSLVRRDRQAVTS